MINSLNNLISNFAKRMPQGDSLMAQHILDIANKTIAEFYLENNLTVKSQCVWYKKGAIGIKYESGLDAEIFSKHQQAILERLNQKGVRTVFRFVMVI